MPSCPDAVCDGSRHHARDGSPGNASDGKNLGILSKSRLTVFDSGAQDELSGESDVLPQGLDGGVYLAAHD